MFQIIWEPYKGVMDTLPNFCTSGQDIWQTMSLLICFHIGEWHLPNRVIRQFGFKQDVPSECNTEPLLHDIDLRTADWSEKIAHLVRTIVKGLLQSAFQLGNSIGMQLKITSFGIIILRDATLLVRSDFGSFGI